jgi:hypothetical protein
VLPKLNPDDYPEKVCCGVLEHLIANGFEFPFIMPFRVEPEEGKQGDFSLQEKWAVSLYKKDSRSLGINQRQKITIFLSYCPFCGKKFGE